jgi:hypothetical protein
MTYSKPEVEVLGNAVELIQGSKPNHGDGGSASNPAATDSELDD